ncbi:hypothetical protein BV25DRAFT_1867189 [Artomyces pyxidatus]|uniref:Uncharacterized protein n=1 Tax=Artomyces pyxidatus TaxID=48021 RepID=A0ACB8TIA9_9AGAM|nr:hypothetical protein BV25DRAFT_1867189 [Artomyces pyxidatus]
MENFINLAKEGYEAYSSHQSQQQQPQGGGDSDFQRTGGSEYNTPHHSQQGGSSSPQFNEDEVVQTAQNHGSGDSGMFQSALGFLHQNKSQHGEPVDEAAVQDSHQKAYHQGAAGDLDASSMGSAAALQVLQKFTSGGGGGSQSQLISMAMAEATKLFDASGGAASGSKQDAVNGAAMTVMKLLVQSKFSGMMDGGNSGGLGGLLSMASKFA